MSKEVFCIECHYYEKPEWYEDSICLSKPKKGRDAIEEFDDFADPRWKNKNNNCKEFKVRQSKLKLVLKLIFYYPIGILILKSKLEIGKRTAKWRIK